MQKQKVIINPYTSENIYSLTSLWNELGKTYTEKINEINRSLNKHPTGLSEEQIQEIKTVFQFFDQDHDGRLNETEFHSCLTGIGVKASNQDAIKYMREFDTTSII